MRLYYLNGFYGTRVTRRAYYLTRRCWHGHPHIDGGDHLRIHPTIGLGVLRCKRVHYTWFVTTVVLLETIAFIQLYENYAEMYHTVHDFEAVGFRKTSNGQYHMTPRPNKRTKTVNTEVTGSTGSRKVACYICSAHTTCLRLICESHRNWISMRKMGRVLHHNMDLVYSHSILTHDLAPTGFIVTFHNVGWRYIIQRERID